MDRGRIAVEARRQVRSQMRHLADDLRHHRLDAGWSQARVAAAAGISASHLCRIEAGLAEPSLDTLMRVAAALGGDVSVRFFPGTGPRLRDHLQAAMSEALLAYAGQGWQRRLEVVVRDPVHGVIDLVLWDPAARTAVAVEVHSQLRRAEQQVRWAQQKALALPRTGVIHGLGDADPPAITTLLVLRSTAANRRAVGSFPALFSAAFPAPMRATLDALRDPTVPWPGPALLWASVEAGAARLLTRPPRGLQVGR